MLSCFHALPSNQADALCMQANRQPKYDEDWQDDFERRVRASGPESVHVHHPREAPYMPGQVLEISLGSPQPVRSLHAREQWVDLYPQPSENPENAADRHLLLINSRPGEALGEAQPQDISLELRDGEAVLKQFPLRCEIGR